MLIEKEKLNFMEKEFQQSIPYKITYRKMVNDVIKKPNVEFYEMRDFDEIVLKEKLELLVKDGSLHKLIRKRSFQFLP